MSDRRDTLLILEDSPARIQGFERVLATDLPEACALIANTADAFKKLVTENQETTFAASLDHDLYPTGVDDAGDGMQVAAWIADQSIDWPVIIHTSNGGQCRRMQGVLEAAACDVRLAGAIGEHWIERDWIIEVVKAYKRANSQA